MSDFFDAAGLAALLTVPASLIAAGAALYTTREPLRRLERLVELRSKLPKNSKSARKALSREINALARQEGRRSDEIIPTSYLIVGSAASLVSLIVMMIGLSLQAPGSEMWSPENRIATPVAVVGYALSLAYGVLTLVMIGIRTYDRRKRARKEKAAATPAST